jgi:hypothetical protein
MVPGPINQVVTPCSSAHNPKRFESMNDPQKRGDQRSISHQLTKNMVSSKNKNIEECLPGNNRVGWEGVKTPTMPNPKPCMV